MMLNLLTELADLWELQAVADTGGDSTQQKRETLKECADTLRSLLESPVLKERQHEMVSLLQSARAIAEREGKDTAWPRFATSIARIGISGITARTYRVLPSDTNSET